MQVLDYTMQMHRLLPLVASAYAFHFTGKAMLARLAALVSASPLHWACCYNIIYTTVAVASATATAIITIRSVTAFTIVARQAYSGVQLCSSMRW
jgi:hypothetical protein